MNNWRTKKLKKLASTILSIKNQTVLENFLRDLCTIEELDEISSRWEAVLLLAKGESYREIAKKTKMSTTTVSRIAQWLKVGEGGYKAALGTLFGEKK